MPKARRGKTVLEALYPSVPEELVDTAKAWVADCSEIMLGAIWAAYDALVLNPRVRIALAEATDDIERGLTRLLYFELDDLLTGNEPFRLLPEAPEDETRKRPPARPRAYDIAFAMRVNPRIMWSIEAKILPTPRTIAEYLKTLKERFLTGDYAPFVSEGVMAGYLIEGTAVEAFEGISEQLDTPLGPLEKWKARQHRVSIHKRTVPEGRPYSKRFSCHHLMLEFS